MNLIRGFSIQCALALLALSLAAAAGCQADGAWVRWVLCFLRSPGSLLDRLRASLRPGGASDPLAYDWTVDEQLRQLFNVEEIPAAAPPGKSSLEFFITAAYAAEPRALDRWVPTREELGAYETRVAELLQKTSAAELQRANLAAPYDKIYRSMVPTTALIESCWRQYVVRGGKVSYLRSGAGSVGIMQINQVVWRGFYEIERLR